MAKIKNPLTIVSGGGGSTLITKSITANGTYDAQDDSADGYSEVTVNVPPTLFRQLVDKSITTVTAEDLAGVTSIGSYAFSYCPSLTSVETSSSVLEIKNAAFLMCENLTDIIISDSVTSIGRNAFEQGGYVKKKFIIGSGISTIEFASFRYNYVATFFVIKATTVPTLVNANAFTYTNNCPIYVPTPDSYKVETNWSTYASRIFPLVSTVSDLTNIDTTTYTKACVIGADNSYKQYTWDGSQWNEVT